MWSKCLHNWLQLRKNPKKSQPGNLLLFHLPLLPFNIRHFSIFYTGLFVYYFSWLFLIRFLPLLLSVFHAPIRIAPLFAFPSSIYPSSFPLCVSLSYNLGQVCDRYNVGADNFIVQIHLTCWFEDLGLGFFSYNHKQCLWLYLQYSGLLKFGHCNRYNGPWRDRYQFG